MSETESLIEILKSFNAKERFFLVGQILGNPDFKPSSEFLAKLSGEVGIPITGDVFAAMDYHLDWIYASLEIYRKKNGDGPYDNQVVYLEKGDEARIIRGQQEDIDFLIAFELDNKYHLVLIEAKGVTDWNGKQMESKVQRFKEIFGEDGTAGGEAVIPHFVMMSQPTKKLQEHNREKYPKLPWMFVGANIPFIDINIPKVEKLRYVVRCSKNNKDEYTEWKVKRRKKF